MAMESEDRLIITRILKRKCEVMPASDLSRLCAEATTVITQNLINDARLPLDPRFLAPKQLHKLMRMSIPQATQSHRNDFLMPLVLHAERAIGSVALENPDAAQFNHLVNSLLAAWDEATVHVLVAATALSDYPASKVAQDYVRATLWPEPIATEPPVSSAVQLLEFAETADGSDRIEPIPLADMVQLLHSPLSRLLSRSAIDCAYMQVGALSAEEHAAMLTELLSLNSTQFPTWYHVGFACGLSIIDAGFAADRLEISQSAQEWRLWGWLEALRQADSTEDARGVILNEWPTAIRLFTSGMGQTVASFACKCLLSSSPDLVVNLIEALPITSNLPPEFELEIARQIDDESVRLLRMNDGATALALLSSARERMEKWPTWRDDSDTPSDVAEFLVRFAIGISAAQRMVRDVDDARRNLQAIPPETVARTTNRTRARFYIQLLLSETGVRDIRSVELPRNESSCTNFRRTYEPHEPLLLKALKDNDSAADAWYVLAGLRISRAEHADAVTALGKARSGYMTRSDRKDLLPQIHWQQLYIAATAPGESTTATAIDELIENFPQDIRVQTEEADALIAAVTESLTSRIGDVFSLLNSAAKHKWPHDSKIEEAIRQMPHITEVAVSAVKHLSQHQRRLEVLISLLDRALLHGDEGAVTMLIDAVDEIRNSNSKDAHVVWAHALRTNVLLRDYLGNIEADMFAVAEVMQSGNRNECFSILTDVVESQWPVMNPADQVRITSIIDELRTISPELADDLLANAKMNLPVNYERWREAEQSVDEPSSPVTVLFVGGMEERQRETLEIAKATLARTNPEITLLTETPGWSSNWSDAATRVESHYRTIDALVILYLTRTNFGRFVRLSAGRNQKPWVGCTGIGQTRMITAIQEAANLARNRRGR